MILKEEVKPDAGRVTAGLPSLDSSKRFQIDSDKVREDFFQKLEAEREAKESHSLLPDGDKPRTVLEISKGRQLSAEQLIQRLSALNPNLWFERSKAVPTEMGVYLRIPVTQDEPEGLRFIGGFSAVRPINERDWVHTKQKWTHTRTPGVLKEITVQCHGCAECRKHGAIGGVVRGYRMLLKRLEDAKIIAPTQSERMFGSGETKNWQARHA